MRYEEKEGIFIFFLTPALSPRLGSKLGLQKLLITLASFWDDFTVERNYLRPKEILMQHRNLKLTN